MKTVIVAVALSGVCASGAGQIATPAQEARGVTRFTLDATGLISRGPVRPRAIVADEGRRSAIFGTESGSFEVWVWPHKLIRDFRLAFKLADQAEPTPGSMLARDIIARPEGTTVVHAHPAFTVRQHMLVPLNEPGVIVLLEIESVRPLEILVSMQPEFSLAWPGWFGGGSITWQPDRRRLLLVQGGVRPYQAIIGSPFATSGTAGSRYGAQSAPTQFTIGFDPATANHEYIPIVMVGGAAARDSVELVYHRLLERAASYWREKVTHYRELRQGVLSMAAPDAQLNQALEWSRIGLDQQFLCNPDLGCGLMTGFRHAGSNSGGNGWFLSADPAITALAMSSIGLSGLARDGLRSMILQQAEDGRIGFRNSATPFWIMAVHAYWAATGDDAFLRQHWTNLARAFRWAVSTDRNRDGLMGDSIPVVGGAAASPSEEDAGIHLMGAWVAALETLSSMARAAGDVAIANQAAALHGRAQQSLERIFWLDSAGIYVSGLMGAGSGAPALTAWPGTALAFGQLEDARANRMLREIGSAAITADWGLRALSRFHPLHDPLRPDRGAVWTALTGFGALAHYRYHRGWAGFELVRDLSRATFDFGRGRTPQLLSGAYYDVLEAPMARPFFATALYVLPLVQGLIGLQVDAPNQGMSLEPHLPAEWSTLGVNNIAVGPHRVWLTIQRGEGKYEISLRKTGPSSPLFVRLSPALPLGARVERARVYDRDVAVQVEETAHDVHAIVEFALSNAADVEVEYSGGIEAITPTEPLQVGDRSSGLKLLDFRREGRDFVALVEGDPTATYSLAFRAETRVRSVSGADVVEQANQRLVLRLRIGAGAASQFARREIRLRT